MNLKNIFKSALPHILVILGFVALSYAYFSPILAGKSLPQMDDTHVVGMTKELVDYEANHPGEHPTWSNSMFGGMPSYLTKGVKVFNIFHELMPYSRLFLPYTTVGILFIMLLSFYFLLQVLKFNRWLSIGGAIGFAFASFNLIIISVGHITQAYSLAYMPLMFAGVLLLFNRKYFIGAIVTTIAFGFELSSGHPQIAYYAFLTILILFITKLVYAIKEKELKHFFIVGCITAGAFLVAFAPNIVQLWTVNEYGKYSIRGATELTTRGIEKVSSGLDKNYALAWSYGKAETFCALVPNFMAPGVNGFDENSKTAQELQKIGVQDPGKAAASFPAYWGDKPFTAGPNYFGAIICFLFILGLYLVKGAKKWWLLSAAILSFMLAWGRNFMVVTDLFFYYFPGYNKFRTVEMIIIIANFCFVFLGFLAIKEIIDGKATKEQKLKALRNTSIIVGGLLFIFIVIPGWFFDFTSLTDNALIANLKANKWPQDMVNSLLAAMRDDRESILRADAIRSFIFIALAAGLIWLYVSKGIKVIYLSIGLTVLILVDLWSVDRRYINSDSFVSKSDYQNQISKSPADEFILKDPDPNYRVLNMSSGDIFSDGYTPYFHKSIGGYHGAKMRRYQDLINGPLSADIKKIQNIFGKEATPQSINDGLKQLSILNMLNTKYIIFNPQSAPIINSAAYGNAWFVKEIKWVTNADEEYASIANFNPLQTAIVDKKWENDLTDAQNIKFDSTATIKLLSYKPNSLEYSSKSNSKQLAIFSEIFYDKGWVAYIDGVAVNHGRADYILRALTIPEGEHKIEFKFNPKSVTIGKSIATGSSILFILVVLGAIVYSLKKKQLPS